MSDQIREQVSAFLDGELPSSETALLLKRLTRDAELRESFGRYALIGESLRGAGHARLSQSFSAKVNRAIDGEPAMSAITPGARSGAVRWWRPIAGVAVAAGVAAVAVVALQQRQAAPSMRSVPAITAQNAAPVHEQLSYTVPAAVPNGPTALPAARLTNYVFAHSRYSTALGQNDVLNDLLSSGNDGDAAANPSPRNARSP